MKAFLVGLFMFSATSAFAYNVTTRSCEFWTYLSTPTGGGFICSSYPNMLVVPEGNSTQATITSLEAKIASLEARVKALEEKTK